MDIIEKVGITSTTIEHNNKNKYRNSMQILVNTNLTTNKILINTNLIN
jgi:hypothetical protein